MEEDSVIDESPNSDLLSRMVGHSNESNIIVNGEKTCALVDTGSMITCMSKKFYHSLSHKPELRSIDDFDLKIFSAEGSSLPLQDMLK